MGAIRFERLPSAFPFPAVIFGGFEGDRLLGAGALSWVGGRCWLEFSAGAAIPCRYAVHVVRQARRMLRMARQVGETEVLVLRNDAHSTSERLLQAVGFELCGVACLPDRQIEVWSHG